MIICLLTPDKVKRTLLDPTGVRTTADCCLCAAVQAAPVAGDSAPKKGSIQKWENGFQLERLAMGQPDGKLAKPGKKVVVRYRGSLQNGKVFDETKGNKTFSFRLGEI